MKINPLSENFFSKKINSSYNIFFIYGNNFGLIDICYANLKKNLEIDLQNPFSTNYFDENKLLNYTESFLDELYSISLFGEKKTIIVDIRQGDKKKDISNIFNSLNFTEIKENQIIIIGYMFKQTDQLTKKMLDSKNVICFACYEENEYKLKNKIQSELTKINLRLNDTQIYELMNRLSKDTKIIQNTIEKIKLNKKNININYDQLLNLIDDDNNKTTYEMINNLLIGNYYESVSLLKKFEQLNTSSVSILFIIKVKLKLLKKCLNMKQKGFTKQNILNDKSLNIFFNEKPILSKMIDLWTFNNVDLCLYQSFKTELNCKSKKDHEYIFLNQLFLYIYYTVKN